MTGHPELPFTIEHDQILIGRLAAEEKERRIRYAWHELFMKLGDDLPGNEEVVIKLTEKREVMLADCMEKGSFYSEGDLRVKLKIAARKLHE